MPSIKLKEFLQPQLQDKPHSSFLALWVQTALLSLTLTLVCLLGDRLCASLAGSGAWRRALSDNLTHGAIGLASWAVVALPGRLGGPQWGQCGPWLQCGLCGLLASVIDVDHFLQARSFQLKDAISLEHRPPLHSTTLVLVISGVLWVASLSVGGSSSCSSSSSSSSQLKTLSLLCFVAGLSHHLRDATRRGLWFTPLVSTPPVPYSLYVAATVGVALLARLVWVSMVTVKGSSAAEPGFLSSVITL